VGIIVRVVSCEREYHNNSNNYLLRNTAGMIRSCCAWYTEMWEQIQEDIHLPDAQPLGGGRRRKQMGKHDTHDGLKSNQKRL
jgi:hypothetical protein